VRVSPGKRTIPIPGFSASWEGFRYRKSLASRRPAPPSSGLLTLARSLDTANQLEQRRDIYNTPAGALRAIIKEFASVAADPFSTHYLTDPCFACLLFEDGFHSQAQLGHFSRITRPLAI
jgi:hypothetical protein